MTRYQRIILHAGLHKTGTTSVQENCFRHRDLLLQHGVEYPVFSFRERQIINHSDPLAGVFSSRPRAYGMARRQGVEDDPAEASTAFTGQLNKILAEPRGTTLLLSAEMVSDFNANDMQALRRRLQDATDDFHVIAYVRSPQSSLASILQQRALAGSAVDPHKLVNLVGQRFKRLRQGFGDILQLYNFHEAAVEDGGLVGHFFRALGLPQATVDGLEFSRANPKMPMEAYRLMQAINRAYPVDGVASHGVKRHYHDLRPLYALPGQPFRIECLQDQALSEALASQSQWLATELGWEFPEVSHHTPEPLWQTPTLLELETAISTLGNSELRNAAARALEQEARDIEETDAATAAVLRFIATSIARQGDCPPQFALDRLGADYFKFAALQFEQASPQTALYLMSLASQLRPGAAFIEERIQHYRSKLDGSRDQGIDY